MDLNKYKDAVFNIIGAAMSVHRNLGYGLLEPIYNEALHLELQDRGIKNLSEEALPCFYKHHAMKKSYRMDIVVDDIVVELKSVQKLNSAHRMQLFNYLRLTRKPIGLLINFGEDSLRSERWAYDMSSNTCHLLDKNMQIVPGELNADEDWWYEDPYAMVVEHE